MNAPPYWKDDGDFAGMDYRGSNYRPRYQERDQMKYPKRSADSAESQTSWEHPQGRYGASRLLARNHNHF